MIEQHYPTLLPPSFLTDEPRKARAIVRRCVGGHPMQLLLEAEKEKKRKQGKNCLRQRLCKQHEGIRNEREKKEREQTTGRLLIKSGS